jgi:phosphoribosylanthranilate isomerase
MTKVKICGLTRPEDAKLAVELGAWTLGMIMWPASPRYVDPQHAAEIADQYRRSAEIAGVFVDAKIDHVVQLANEIGLSIIQLHGNEGQQYCEVVAQRTGARVIKAFRVQNRSVLAEMGKYWDVNYHLLDSYKAGVPGGTGQTFDWSFVRESKHTAPLILSGGLTPENVAEAITVVRPYAVDVASGVELAPGVKDQDKMRAFFQAVRSVDLEDEEAEPLTGAESEVLTLEYARREAAEKREAKQRAEAVARRREFANAEVEQAAAAAAVQAEANAERAKEADAIKAEAEAEMAEMVGDKGVEEDSDGTPQEAQPTPNRTET